jgi:hypothetical protein
VAGRNRSDVAKKKTASLGPKASIIDGRL